LLPTTLETGAIVPSHFKKLIREFLVEGATSLFETFKLEGKASIADLLLVQLWKWVFIHYKNLTYTNTSESVGNTLEDRNRYSTQIIGNAVNVRKYNQETCRIDLPKLYSEMVDS
jgi:hypothetical protein